MVLINNLEIIIITYNRPIQLDYTLLQIQPSPFSNCKITILDNCSTDNTKSIYDKYITQFSNLNYLSNKTNIGADANIIRAFEISNGYYTWVLCDDDKFNFSFCDDVIKVINEGQVNLIHMGAHDFRPWNLGGSNQLPTVLVKNGYDYFKYSSFLPCNLFKTSFFYKSIIESYSNIGNHYPHMIPVINAYELQEPIYIATNRIVTAVVGLQGNVDNFLGKWLNTCLKLKDKNDIKTAFFSEPYQGMKIFRLYWLTYVFYTKIIDFKTYKTVINLYKFSWIKMIFYLISTPVALPFLPIIRKLKNIKK